MPKGDHHHLRDEDLWRHVTYTESPKDLRRQIFLNSIVLGFLARKRTYQFDYSERTKEP